MEKLFRFKSIRARIITLMLPLTILSMLLLLLLCYQSAKGIINHEIDDKMHIELDRTALSIEEILSEHSKIAESLARTVEVTGAQMEKDQYALLLQNVLSMNNDTFGSGIWFEPNQYKADMKYFGPYAYRDKSEIVYTEDYSTVEYDYPSWDWYKIGMNTKETIVWSPAYVDGVSNVTMITATAPFYDNAKIFMGVTTADIDLTSVQKMILDVNVGTVSVTAEESASSTDEILGSIHETASSMEEIAQTSKSQAELAENLSSMVAQFKL